MDVLVLDAWGNNGAVVCPQDKSIRTVSTFAGGGKRKCPTCGGKFITDMTPTGLRVTYVPQAQENAS